jgi:hypothetical protein
MVERLEVLHREYTEQPAEDREFDESTVIDNEILDAYRQNPTDFNKKRYQQALRRAILEHRSTVDNTANYITTASLEILERLQNIQANERDLSDQTFILASLLAIMDTLNSESTPSA